MAYKSNSIIPNEPYLFNVLVQFEQFFFFFTHFQSLCLCTAFKTLRQSTEFEFLCFIGRIAAVEVTFRDAPYFLVGWIVHPATCQHVFLLVVESQRFKFSNLVYIHTLLTVYQLFAICFTTSLQHNLQKFSFNLLWLFLLLERNWYGNYSNDLLFWFFFLRFWALQRYLFFFFFFLINKSCTEAVPV